MTRWIFIVMFLSQLSGTTIAMDTKFLVSIMNETKECRVLVRNGNIRQGISRLEPLMEQLKQRAKSTESEVDKHEYMCHYVQLAHMLDHYYRSLLSQRSEDGTEEVIRNLQMERVDSMVSVAKNIRMVKDSPSGHEYMRFASSYMYNAALVMLELKKKEKAKEYITECTSLLEQFGKDGSDWKTQSDLFKSKMTESYICNMNNFKSFLKDVEVLLELYKDKDWVCRVAMSLTTQIPGFFSTLDSFRLYYYYLLLEKKLRDNQADPLIPMLYDELAATARLLGLNSEVGKWSVIFLDRYPDSHLATVVRKRQAITNEEEGKYLEEILIPIQDLSKIGGNDVNLVRTKSIESDSVPKSEVLVSQNSSEYDLSTVPKQTSSEQQFNNILASSICGICVIGLLAGYLIFIRAKRNEA